MKIFGLVGLLAVILSACGGGDGAGGGASNPSANVTADTNSGTSTSVLDSSSGSHRSDGSARFDKNGNLIGVYGVPYNPCNYKPCTKK